MDEAVKFLESLDFKTLNYRLDSGSFDCKNSRIFGFWVCRREKSSFFATIALIRCGLHFVEWLYKQ